MAAASGSNWSYLVFSFCDWNTPVGRVNFVPEIARFDAF